ncbi:hypothetical protein FO519_000478 [Halicephalobus sp. NKZ332]|nr:hypothetical protein FO519_000478 [Halicephalobus sp. NKZ332]
MSNPQPHPPSTASSSAGMSGPPHGMTVKKGPDMEKMTESFSGCVQLTRKMRDIMVNSQPFNQLDGDHIKGQLAIRQLQEQARQLNKCYNDFEKLAKNLPPTTPITPTLDTLGKYINEANADIFTMANFDKACDEVAYTNYTHYFSYMIHDFLPQMVSQKTRSDFGYDPPLPDFTFDKLNSQRDFEKVFENFIAEHNRNASSKGGQTLQFQYLERSVLHCIIEVPMNAPTVGKDKQMLMMSKENKEAFKFILLINNGNIDYINLYALNEDYTYLDENRTNIDVYAPSKSKLHRSLRRVVNTNYQNFVNTGKGKTTDISTRLSFMFTVVNRIGLVFNNTCRVCHKAFKNGMPPVNFDVRTKTSTHEDCR